MILEDCGHVIDSYDEIAIIEFINWIYNDKKVYDLCDLNKNEVIDFIFIYLQKKNENPSWERINYFINALYDKETVVERARAILGSKRANKINTFYFNLLQTKYSALLLYKFNNSAKKSDFFNSYFLDLDSLTDNYLNIFYSERDTLLKSGYAIFNQLNSNNNHKLKSLPCALIWETKKGIDSSNFFSLKEKNKDEIFVFFEKVINSIRKNEFGLIKYTNKTTKGLPKKLEEIKELIRKDKIDIVLEELYYLIEQSFFLLINDLILIQNQHTRIKELDTKNIANPIDIQIQKNRLIIQILEFIDKIKSTSPTLLID